MINFSSICSLIMLVSFWRLMVLSYIHQGGGYNGDYYALNWDI